MNEPNLAVSPRRCIKILREAGFRPHPVWESFGPSGFIIRTSKLMPPSRLAVISGSVIASQAEFDDIEWIHASISWQSGMPTYEELVVLKHAIFGPKRHAYQVFPDSAEHVNMHEFALHLWGRADGERVLPDFTQGRGSI